MAIQAHPSHDNYDIFRDGRNGSQEGMSAAELLSEVKTMAAEPYVTLETDFSCIDSVVTMTRPPPSQLWHTILNAKNDAEKMTILAQDLLNYVSPEKNPAQVIDNIGNPGKKFDDAELRIAFRELLFPEYDALISRHY
jgi:hypothetical protein